MQNHYSAGKQYRRLSAGHNFWLLVGLPHAKDNFVMSVHFMWPHLGPCLNHSIKNACCQHNLILLTNKHLKRFFCLFDECLCTLNYIIYTYIITILILALMSNIFKAECTYCKSLWTKASAKLIIRITI